MHPYLHVIHLPYLSETISYRFHREMAGGVTVLEAFLERNRASKPDGQTVIVGHSRAELDDLKPLAAQYQTRLVLLPPLGEVECLHTLARDFKASSIEYLLFGTGLLPDSFRSRLAAHHHVGGQDFTDVTGAPINASPFWVTFRLLEFLKSIPAAGEAGGVRALFGKVVKAASAMDGGELPLKAGAFGFAEAYGLMAGELPKAIRIDCLDERALTLDYFGRRRTVESDELALDLLRSYRAELCDVVHKRYNRTVSFKDKSDHIRAIMRVTIVSNRCAYSGAEETLVRMIEGLEGRVEAHAVVALDGLLAQRLSQAGVSVKVVGRDFADGRVQTVELLGRIIDEMSPDIVHLNGACGAAILHCAAAREIPIVQHLRSPDFDSLGESLYLASKVISVSDYLKDLVKREDIPADKVAVVYDGIDTLRFRPGIVDRREARAAFGIPENARVLLCIARITANKRLDLLIDAFSDVAKRMPEALLLICGEPDKEFELLTALRNQVAALECRDRIRFIGFQKDIRPLESAADVQALVSENEPLGTCILESMALGIPVIVSDQGGLREVVNDGINGFVVPAGNRGVLAARVETLLQDGELRARFGTAARSTIETSFSREHIAAKMSLLYRDTLIRSRREALAAAM